jgi:hypothetical protein
MGNEGDQKRGTSNGTGSPAADPQGPAPGKQTASPYGEGVDPNAQIVASEWMIDWVGKQTGATVNAGSTQRQGNGDAAYGHLKIRPGTGGGKVVELDWVNAAKAGAVTVLKMPHVKDIGGIVATNVQYGRAPSASATVQVSLISNDATKKAPPPSDLAAKQKAAGTVVMDKLPGLLENDGSMLSIPHQLEDAANAVIGAAPDGFSYSVQVGLRPGPLTKPADGSPAEAKYDSFAGPGRRKITIFTKTEWEKLRGKNGATQGTLNQEEQNKLRASGQTTTQDKDSITVTSQHTEIKQFVSQQFQKAWETFKSSKVTDDGHIHGYVEGHLAAKENANVDIKDLKIDFGKLLGLIAAAESPALGLILNKALGTGTVNGGFKVDLDGKIGGNAGFNKKWSSEEVKRNLDKMDIRVKTESSATVSSSVDTYVRDHTTTTSGTMKVDEAKKLQQQQRVAQTERETLDVVNVVHPPVLQVTNE